MVFTLPFNIAVSRVILQHWQWQSVGYGPVKNVKICFRTSTLDWTVKVLDCTSALSWRLKIWNSLPHFCYALTAKDLMFRFRTFALPWLPKIWSSTSALSFCIDCVKCDVPLPHFLDCQICEVLLPLFLDWQRSEVPLSALVLPGLPKMWSFASAFHLCLDFQRFAVSLLHFRSILTAKDLKIGFSTNTLPSLPNMGSSASALPYCLDCKRSVVSHFRSAFIPKDVNALLLCLDCQSSAASVPL